SSEAFELLKLSASEAFHLLESQNL
ncbi:hypothetical protein A2U01_0088886, partial [Trifolium medium]|nr:hypothetical protein [Trifolium medium]